MTAIPAGLPRRQAQLLAELGRQSALTIREYQRLAGISRTTASRDLTQLTRQGLLLRLGRARASRYAIPERLFPNQTTIRQLSNKNQPQIDPLSLPSRSLDV